MPTAFPRTMFKHFVLWKPLQNTQDRPHRDVTDRQDTSEYLPVAFFSRDNGDDRLECLPIAGRRYIRVMTPEISQNFAYFQLPGRDMEALSQLQSWLEVQWERLRCMEGEDLSHEPKPIIRTVLEVSRLVEEFGKILIAALDDSDAGATFDEPWGPTDLKSLVKQHGDLKIILILRNIQADRDWLKGIVEPTDARIVAFLRDSQKAMDLQRDLVIPNMHRLDFLLGLKTLESEVRAWMLEDAAPNRIVTSSRPQNIQNAISRLIRAADNDGDVKRWTIRALDDDSDVLQVRQGSASSTSEVSKSLKTPSQHPRSGPPVTRGSRISKPIILPNDDEVMDPEEGRDASNTSDSIGSEVTNTFNKRKRTAKGPPARKDPEVIDIDDSSEEVAAPLPKKQKARGKKGANSGTAANVKIKREPGLDGPVKSTPSKPAVKAATGKKASQSTTSTETGISKPKPSRRARPVETEAAASSSLAGPSSHALAPSQTLSPSGEFAQAVLALAGHEFEAIEDDLVRRGRLCRNNSYLILPTRTCWLELMSQVLWCASSGRSMPRNSSASRCADSAA